MRDSRRHRAAGHSAVIMHYPGHILASAWKSYCLLASRNRSDRAECVRVACKCSFTIAREIAACSTHTNSHYQPVSPQRSW